MGFIQRGLWASALALATLDPASVRAADDWCDKPLTNICQWNGAAQKRVKGLEEFRMKAQARARTRAAKEVEGLSESSPFRPPLLKMWTHFYTQNEFAREAAVWEEVMAGGPMRDIQGYVLDAIGEEFSQGNVDARTYRGMLERASSVRYVRAATLYEQIFADSKLRKALSIWFQVAARLGRVPDTSELDEPLAVVVAMMQSCGSDASIANAFLTTVNGTPYVLYCPAQILMNVAVAGNENEAFQASFQMMAHEIGHSIEDEFPTAYADMNACFKVHYGKRVRPSGSYFLETGADFWAGRALEIYLRGIPALQSRREAAARAFQWMCTGDTANVSNTDSGRHPPVDVRMGSMFLNSESVRELLGCSPRVDRTPSCGLAGGR